MSKRKSEDILISHYYKEIKKLEQQKERRRALIYLDSENEDLGQSSDGTLTPNQVEKEEKRQEREANLAEEAPKLERLQKEEKDKLKEQKAKERKDKKRLEKERPDAGAVPGLPVAPHRTDLGQSSDGTPTPRKGEKRLEHEAKLAEEAPKLERLQKEEKDKLKEQKAKERKDKKRLEKERPDAGAVPGLPVAPHRTDLGQSSDGTPTPRKGEKRLEHEAKLAEEAPKLERLQKEEKDKLKEQKAKERKDKKRLEKERPVAGAVPGLPVAPLCPPEIPAHLDPTIIVDDTLVATENMEIPVDIELPQDTPISTDESLHQAATDTNLELDPEMRLALGDPAEDTLIYGENIHADIAQRWERLLRKGLTKEIKEKLSKEHKVPDNCRLLKAPSLNSEFAEGVAYGVRAADSNIERKQSQLGLGITAISKAMSTLINDGKKIDVIKLLQEGCRLLCDLHYAKTETRKGLIWRRLDKSFRTSWIIHDEERDDTLFGRNCLRRLKQQNHRKNHLTEFDSRETGQTLLDIPRRTGGGQGGTYTPSRSTPTTSYQRIQTPTTYTAPPPPSPPPPQAGPQVRQQSVRGRSPTRH